MSTKTTSERNDETTRDKDMRGSRKTETTRKQEEKRILAVHVVTNDDFEADTEVIRPADDSVKLYWLPADAKGSMVKKKTLVRWDEISPECQDICVMGKKGQTSNLVEIDGKLLYWRSAEEVAKEKAAKLEKQSYGVDPNDVKVQKDRPMVTSLPGDGDVIKGIKSTTQMGETNISVG